MHALFLPEKLTRFEEVYKRNFNRNEGKAQSLTPYITDVAHDQQLKHVFDVQP